MFGTLSSMCMPCEKQKLWPSQNALCNVLNFALDIFTMTFSSCALVNEKTNHNGQMLLWGAAKYS